MILKCVLRPQGSSELVAFTMDAASHGQARCFVRESMPDTFIVSLKKVGWKLEQHFDFPTVSHTVHIARHTAARKQRGVVGLPVMDV